MSIKVIGAGFGRTGTKSLQAALQTLGFGPCYHMETLIRNPADVVYWKGASDGDYQWDSLFNDYRSVVDFPGCLFVETLYRHYPGSKVVLTLRDPDSWYESALATIYQSSPSPSVKLKILKNYSFSSTARDMARLNRFVNKLIWQGYFSGRFLKKSFAIAKYNEHIETIKSVIPDRDLLLFSPADGWRPLCEFLQVPAPDQDFPNLNQRKKFNFWLNKNVARSVDAEN